MDTGKLKILDYDRIIEMLKKQAGSEMAEEAISELMPVFDVSDRDEILQRQQETSEAVRLIRAKGPLPIGSIIDIAGMLSFASKGGTLTMAQLLRILRTLRTTGDVIAYMKGDDVPDIPLIRSMTELLSINTRLMEDIDRCILSKDEMSDNASPQLRDIRRAIVRKGESLRGKMDQILNSAGNRNILQDAIITVRNGRYVIPVKQEHKGDLPGIVHDQSGSGATLFIEPQAIVQMNNELRQLQIEEQAEITRILEQLSSAVAQHRHEIANDQIMLVLLDVIMAKGRLSIEMDGEEPIISEDGIMELVLAAHPLIDRDKVVPINISIGHDFKTMVITGPNTGGKTVTLKTCGLLALMAQAGLHIPAAAGSRLPVFEKILADIGDEQSIEQSLSTFSSHISNISGILEKADDKSLILLDELGAGTDPAKGAALAISILEEIKRRGAYCMATTHYTELKKYAMSAEGVENASMEFDVESLSPTYRLTVGLPGKSNAFEIASKLGISSGITDRAAELMDAGDIAFDDVIRSLEEEQKKIEDMRMEIQRQQEEIRIRYEESSRDAEKRRRKAEDELADAKSEARRIIMEAKDVSDEVKKELKALNKLDDMGELGDLNRRHDAVRGRLRELEKASRQTIVKEENTAPVDPESLEEGDRVKVLTIGQNGEIISLPDDRGELQVRVGSMKVSAHVDDIMLIDRKPVKKPAHSPSRSHRQGRMFMDKKKTVSTSVDVRGKNLDDALMDVEKYIDDAFLSGLPEVTIIHGRGGGVLSRGIRQRLREMKNVSEYHRGAYDEGGDGVTVVKLKL